MSKLNRPAPLNQRHTPLADLAQTWQKLINELSHHLFNHLALLQMGQTSIDNNLPTLIEGYLLAVKHQLIKNTMTIQQIDEFTEQLQLRESIDPMYKLLGRLQHYCALLCKEETGNPPYLASVCLEKILASYSYPGNPHKGDLIELNLKDDFVLTASPALVSTLLTLLLNFAYRHRSDSPGDQIKISLKTKQQANCLHCKIVTIRITEGICKHFFEQSFNLDSENITPGPGWCRLTLLHAGGNLYFTLKEKHYVEFIILFPRAGKQTPNPSLR